LKTSDYFFRYDKGVTNVFPKSFLWRLFFGKFMDSNALLKIVEIFRKIIPDRQIPVTVDTFLPFSQVDTFLERYGREINFFPLRCVPYKLVRNYERISDDFLKTNKDQLFLDLAIYWLEKSKEKDYYQIIEDKLMAVWAIKTLISTNHYSEEDFWKIWNHKNYLKAKKRTDPNNVFRDLYAKTCQRE
jgi:hypothetical protein